MAQSSIRIIGGKWRSRKVSFSDKEDLRPTPDRVRETLFNWLAPQIREAVCLDLFAGSGVLGLEALSRGAKSVLALDNDPENVQQIVQTKQLLQAEDYEVLRKDVLTWLQQNEFVADIVFVDPPYKNKLVAKVLHLLEERKIVHVNSLIYFEQDEPVQAQELPENWSLWREAKAGQVFYYLAIKER